MDKVKDKDRFQLSSFTHNTSKREGSQQQDEMETSAPTSGRTYKIVVIGEKTDGNDIRMNQDNMNEDLWENNSQGEDLIIEERKYEEYESPKFILSIVEEKRIMRP